MALARLLTFRRYFPEFHWRDPYGGVDRVEEVLKIVECDAVDGAVGLASGACAKRRDDGERHYGAEEVSFHLFKICS